MSGRLSANTFTVLSLHRRAVGPSFSAVLALFCFVFVKCWKRKWFPCNRSPKKLLKYSADMALASGPPSLQVWKPLSQHTGKADLANPGGRTSPRLRHVHEQQCVLPARGGGMRRLGSSGVLPGAGGAGDVLPRTAQPAGKTRDGNVRLPSERTETSPKDVKTTGENKGNHPRRGQSQPRKTDP